MLRIQTITLALALCGGTAVAAGAQAASAAPKADTTALSSSGKQQQMHSGRTGRAERALFKGIELSSAQRAKVDSIHKKYEAEVKPLHEQMKPAMEEARAARQSGDSAKFQAARQSMSGPRDKLVKLRNQEVAEVRGVLTPEQQSTFDKNVSSAKERMRHERERHGSHPGGSHTS